MKNGCRDCNTCTRGGLQGCFFGLLEYATLGLWVIPVKVLQVFSRKCPHCGHPLSDHNRRTDGSFKD